MQHPKMIEIAEDYDLWEIYVDPSGNMTEKEFQSLSTKEKVAMQREMFPGEAAEEDAEAAEEEETP